MSYRADKPVIDTHTHGHTDAGNDNTRRPKLASGNENNINIYLHQLEFLEDTGFGDSLLNTLRRKQNGHHFADDTFKSIFFNENVWISTKISLKFCSQGPINNISALVQIMAWHCAGYKPLSEAMMVSLPTHIWVTRPQWVKKSRTSPFHM